MRTVNNKGEVDIAFIALLGFVFFVSFLMLTAVSNFIMSEHRTIQGTITNSDVVTENGQIKYLLLSFNNETPIKVRISRTSEFVDFTVHSQLIVELSRPTWWIFASDVYTVDGVIKVP